MTTTLCLDVGGYRLDAVAAPGGPDAPLIVCIPGAGYDARYFHVPGCSFLDRLAQRGHSAVAITRPGYPADDASARTRPDFAGSAAVLDEAVATVWTRMAGTAPGVVLLGHSVGGAVALHLAARGVQWPLLGVAVSGVGDVPNASAAAFFAQVPAGVPLSLPLEAVRPLFYGPPETFDDALSGAFADALVTAPSGDPIEVNTTWPAQLDDLAPAVRVPVLHAFAEFETLWQTGPSRLAGMAGRFGAAPFVESHLVAGCGHNIEHHYAAEGYAALVSSFAARCAGG